MAVVAPVARTQSVLDHPPNVSGAWVIPAGRAQFNFQHRFDASPPPVRKVTNFPTFLFAVGLPRQATLGFNYSTNSLLTPAFPNEWEFFGRWRPLAQERGAALDLGGTLAYNLAAEGVDAELSAGRRFGRLALIGVVRTLADPDTSTDSRSLAFGGGATLRLRHSLALQGDFVTLTDLPTGGKGAWSAGFALGIPSTPHTVSLYASNAVTSTLQGASRGTDDVRYGFEFTVPLTPGRWFGSRAGAEGAERAPIDSAGPVRTIIINRLTYLQPDIEIAAGTTVIWRNEDQLEHTVTSDSDQFSSGMIPVKGSWSHTFNAPGTFSYHCTPHPFMKGRVVVR